MSKPSTPKRFLHLAAAAAALTTFGVACGDDDGVNDDPFETPADPLAPSNDPMTTQPMNDPMTTQPMDDTMTTDAGG